MSESIWLREADPLRLLETRYPMRGHDSTEPQERKSRLYLLACARKRWAELPPVFRALVWLGETYADESREYRRIRAAVAPLTERLMGASETSDEVQSAQRDLLAEEHIGPELGRAWAAATAAAAATQPPADLRGVATLLHLAFDRLTPTYNWVPPALHDLALLRDVYGNPYRQTLFPAQWRTNTAVLLAKQMYESREFGAMAILADALQDAGCDSDALLNHCRDASQAHARGCWVLDLVLAKK